MQQRKNIERIKCRSLIVLEITQHHRVLLFSLLRRGVNTEVTKAEAGLVSMTYLRIKTVQRMMDQMKHGQSRLINLSSQSALCLCLSSCVPSSFALFQFSNQSIKTLKSVNFTMTSRYEKRWGAPKLPSCYGHNASGGKAQIIRLS